MRLSSNNNRFFFGFFLQSINVIVPTFEENGIFMLGVFFIQSTFADRNNSYQQKLFITH